MSDPTTAVAVPGVTIPGAAPWYHITHPDFSAPMTSRIPGVPLSRREVVVPTVRATGPITEHAYCDGYDGPWNCARGHYSRRPCSLSQLGLLLAYKLLRRRMP
eukprot:1894117-Pyramimonas_sp.AAC.1